MSATYSFSRLGSFENCRLQYKFAYIDRLPSKRESIEAFMGSRVHEALEKQYEFVKNGVVKPKEWLLSHYEELWQKKVHDGLKIVRSEFTADDYFRKGRACLSDYYDAYRPFDQAKVVLTEEKVYFPVKDGGFEYGFSGVIDRLDWNAKERIYEIHDYKTSSTLMTHDAAESDWQLPVYQLALRSRYLEILDARLIWHYLLFNKEVRSSRTAAQLDELEKSIIARIREVEACTDYPPNKSALCEWCDYQDCCPLWKHPKEMERVDVNAYKNDPGVVLVSKYAELEGRKKALKSEIITIEQEQAKIEEAALEFAERGHIQVIDGPDHQLVVTIREELAPPARKDNSEKWERLRETLIRENKFIEVATINSNMFNARIRSWPKEFVAKIKDYLEKRSVRKVDLKEKKL